MITTDATYDTLIASGAYEESITGTLKDGSGTTVLNITNEYIKTGSLTIDNKCINNDDLEPGAVYAAELKITITGNAGLTSSQKSSLQNGSLNLTYTITDGDSSSSIGIGIYYIIEVTLKDEDVEIVAEDMMSRLSKNIPAAVRESLAITVNTPYELLLAAAENCSTAQRPITLVNDETEFESWCNADATFEIPTTADIATYRDLVAEVAKIMGCFATIDKNTNGLILKRLNPHSNSNVWTLNEDIRYRTEKSGYMCRFGKVALGNVSYPTTSDDNVSGLVLSMRATELTEDASGLIENLYNEMAGISYRPCKIDFMGNIALEVGDWIGVNYTEDDTTYTFRTIITHLNWILNGKELIEATGSSAATTKKVGSKGSNESRNSSSIDNLTNRIETLESSQGDGGNKIYTSTRIPTSSDTANEGDLWYQMNYTTSSAFDFPDWGYTLPLVYNPGSFRLEGVRSSLELRFYDTVNDIYLYFLFLGGTNYSITYNRLGPTNTFDGFDKDTGELQVTTENEQGTAWSYWNYIPRWNSVNPSYLIANPLAAGYSDHNMSPNIGTTTYNLYSILGYASKISSGRYRLDGFRLITNAFETSWQYGVDNDYNVIARWVYKENNWQVADYIAGDGVTIKNGIISVNGGGGGSDVVVTPKTSTGTNIADIEVDGTTYQLFAPSGGGGEPIETAFIYSNEERVVGVWTDNRPLYQKTVEITSLTMNAWNDIYYDANIYIVGYIPNASWLDTNNQWGEKMPLDWYTTSSIYNRTIVTEGRHKFRLETEGQNYTKLIATLMYTKTTDTPGSGPYVTSGAYAHHYSTDEQVIGTWIDGSTIYERTYDLGSDLTLQDSTWTDIGISVPTNANRCVKAEGIQSDGTSTCIMASIASTNITVQSTKNSGDSIRYLTIQYTKTS